jgi:hypothetical protein
VVFCGSGRRLLDGCLRGEVELGLEVKK